MSRQQSIAAKLQKKFQFSRPLKVQESILLSPVVSDFIFNRGGAVVAVLIELEDVESARAIIRTFAKRTEFVDRGQVEK